MLSPGERHAVDDEAVVVREEVVGGYLDGFYRGAVIEIERESVVRLALAGGGLRPIGVVVEFVDPSRACAVIAIGAAGYAFSQEGSAGRADAEFDIRDGLQSIFFLFSFEYSLIK